MEAMTDETLRALAVVPPDVLRALAQVEPEALRRLGERATGDALPQTANASPGAETRADPACLLAPAPAWDTPMAELDKAFERVDQLLQGLDLNVIGMFGQYGHPRQRWWNVRIDSGGGGVDRLIDNPDYKVAEALAVLGSEVRLAILRSLLRGPKSAAELVADLRMGTTGQAYHHLQELIRTGFVEAQNGRYHFRGARTRVYLTALSLAADVVGIEAEKTASAGEPA